MKRRKKTKVNHQLKHENENCRIIEQQKKDLHKGNIRELVSSLVTKLPRVRSNRNIKTTTTTKKPITEDIYSRCVNLTARQGIRLGPLDDSVKCEY